MDTPICGYAARDVVMLLDEQPSLNVQVAAGHKADPAALARSTLLILGLIRVGSGDYAILPQINLFGEVSRGSGIIDDATHAAPARR